MSATLEATLRPLLHSPMLPSIIAELDSHLRSEAVRRAEFYRAMTDGEKTEFIDGEVILHSPARNRHLEVCRNLMTLLSAHVGLHRLGTAHFEKCLCVFQRNDYEPDAVFFGPEKSAGLEPDTMKFPIPDFIVEILSESTAVRDRGVKFQDYEASGVAEYWIVDPDVEVVEQYLRRGEVLELALKSGSGEIAAVAVPGFLIPIRALFERAANVAALRDLVARGREKETVEKSGGASQPERGN